MATDSRAGWRSVRRRSQQCVLKIRPSPPVLHRPWQRGCWEVCLKKRKDTGLFHLRGRFWRGLKRRGKKRRRMVVFPSWLPHIPPWSWRFWWTWEFLCPSCHPAPRRCWQSRRRSTWSPGSQPARPSPPSPPYSLWCTCGRRWWSVVWCSVLWPGVMWFYVM